MDAKLTGKLIAELRKERGWTQLELSEKLFVSDRTISKWESGIGYPDISQLPELSKIFNVSIDYLLTGNNGENFKLLERSEECAKNNDINLFNQIKEAGLLFDKDSKNKSLLDYIKQYKNMDMFEPNCFSARAIRAGLTLWLPMIPVTNSASRS
jgi:transcriptional regulator with XRE-family HTH domain